MGGLGVWGEVGRGGIQPVLFNYFISVFIAANFPSIRAAATAATCWLVVTVVFSALQVNTEEVKEKELEEKEDIDVRLLAH